MLPRMPRRKEIYLMFLKRSDPRLPPSFTSTFDSRALSSGIMGGGGPRISGRLWLLLGCS